MTNGKSESSQSSGDTQTFEDRDYFIHGGNVFTRSEYVWLLETLGFTKNNIELKTRWPAKITPFWLELIRDKGYKQWGIRMARDGTVVECKEQSALSLFYNSSTPYCHRYSNKDIIVITLAKDKDHAVANANKKRVQQFLSKAWLEHIQQEEEFERSMNTPRRSAQVNISGGSGGAGSFSQAIWPGVASWYAQQYAQQAKATP